MLAVLGLVSGAEAGILAQEKRCEQNSLLEKEPSMTQEHAVQRHFSDSAQAQARMGNHGPCKVPDLRSSGSS